MFSFRDWDKEREFVVVSRERREIMKAFIISFFGVFDIVFNGNLNIFILIEEFLRNMHKKNENKL